MNYQKQDLAGNFGFFLLESQDALSNSFHLIHVNTDSVDNEWIDHIPFRLGTVVHGYDIMETEGQLRICC